MRASYTFKKFQDMTDAESREVLRGRNDPQVRRWMASDRPISQEEHCAFVSALGQSRTCRYWRVERNRQFVGVYSLTGMAAGSAEGGFWIASEARAKMLALGVVFHAVDHVFRTEALQVLRARQLTSNTAAGRLNQLLGFRETPPEAESDSRMTCALLTQHDWAFACRDGAKLRRLVDLAERAP